MLKPLYFYCVVLGLLSAACTSATPPVTPSPTTLPTLTATYAPTATALPSPTPPLPSATPLPPSATPPPEITLLFTGDINPGRCVYQTVKQANDMALPYRPLAEMLQSADILVGSLDGTLSDYNPPVPCMETRNLMGPTEMVQGFQFAGFDAITLATNHSKDCGLVRGCVNDSFFDTLTTLQTAGIQPIGAGRNITEALTPTIITVRGVRFAFLGFSAIDRTLWATDTDPGTGPFDKAVYVDAIRRATEQADVVIPLIHWGTEYTLTINYEQRDGAQLMVDAGATLIIGNHPHHVQGVETFPNGAVAAYALGNFVFDQEWSDGRQFPIQGLLLKATFVGKTLTKVEPIPIHIYDNFQPRLAELDEATLILADVAKSLAKMPKRRPTPSP